VEFNEIVITLRLLDFVTTGNLPFVNLRP